MTAPDHRSWYRINARADAPDVAEVWLYEEIGAWGTTAKQFADDLGKLKARTIEVRLNTPGGEVFDGLAIFNALRSHPAQVTVTVDGLAASIGSVIAQAGDKIIMTPNAQMMIHDAHAVAVGNAKDMRSMADLLDKGSANIASVYADRAGGTVDDWRERMREETWYSADEAVKAGLADEVMTKAGKRSGTPVARADWDLSIFRYPGRSAAPAPTLVNHAPAPAPPEQPEQVEPEFEWPTLAAADLLASVKAGLAEKDVPFDPDYFRTVMAEVALDVPAPTHEGRSAPAPITAEDEPITFDPFTFHSALRRAAR